MSHREEAERIMDGIANQVGGRYTAADLQAGALIVIAHTLLAILEER